MVELPGLYPFADDLRAVLFCDFDGTLTPADIGTTLLRRYSGRGQELEQRLQQCQLSVLEYYRQAIQELSPELTPEEIAAFAQTIGLRPYVRELIAYCHHQGIGVAIVSDGFDAYILPLLAAVELTELPIACNRLKWSCGRLRAEFPWAYESCQETCPSPYPCAACKRAALLSWTPPELPILYVGDGLSDLCPAYYADFVFARGELAKWCQQQGIGFFPYESLFDVRRTIDSLLRHRRLSPRYLPQQRRYQGWTAE